MYHSCPNSSNPNPNPNPNPNQVDLFPGTEHCELVVLLEREDVVPAAPATAAAAAAAAAAATSIDDGATRDARGEEPDMQGGEGGGPAPKKARLCHD